MNVSDVMSYPVPPFVSLPWRERISSVRDVYRGPAKIRDIYGPVALVKLAPKWIAPTIAIVSSPEGARDVLSSSGPAIDKVGRAYEESRVQGLHLFNLDYARWLPRRRTVQPIFTKKYVSSFAVHMARSAEHVTEKFASEQVVDLHDLCRSLTLEVLGRSIFGVPLGEKTAKLAPHVTRVGSYPVRRTTNPARPPKAFPTLPRQRFRRSLSAIHEVVNEAMAAASSDESHEAPLVRLLLDARDPETGRALTAQEIRDELTVFLLAGTETTAMALTYTLWALGHHVDMQERVVDEIHSLGDSIMTAAGADKMGYTRQVLYEAMRMSPGAPVLARHTTEEVVVDGHRIPSGVAIFVAVFALHYDPSLWSNPEEFDPERFGDKNYQQRARWQYLPFGAGPRACVGDHFGLLEALLGIAALVRNLRFESVSSLFPFDAALTGKEVPCLLSIR